MVVNWQTYYNNGQHQYYVVNAIENKLATPAAGGWTGKVSGVTNPAKVMGVDVVNIAKVKGVA